MSYFDLYVNLLQGYDQKVQFESLLKVRFIELLHEQRSKLSLKSITFFSRM